MELYQERVVEEKQQLDDKIEKLRKFIGADPRFPNDIYDGLSDADKALLDKQYEVMTAYSSILAKRIAKYNI